MSPELLKRSRQVIAIAGRLAKSRIADRVSRQVPRPVSQVPVDGDIVDGGSHGEAAVVAPGGGSGAYKNEQRREDVAT